MSSDYIELGPDDVIRERDEYQKPGLDRPWHKVKCWYGDKVSDWPNFAWRRPRSTLIRDAAIELLRKLYCDKYELKNVDESLIDRLFPGAKKLREAIGISVEELREGK